MQTTTTQPVSVEIELSEEDSLIQSTVRDVLTREGAQERARQWWANDVDFDRALWSTLSNLGLTDMVASSAHGGIEAGTLTASVVSEEMGRFAAALPFEMHSTALRLLAHIGASEAPRVSDGVLTVVLVPNDGASAQMVPEGAVADLILWSAAGELLYLADFDREHVASMGMNRFANVTLRANAAGARCEVQASAVENARTFATTMFASRMVGLGDWMLSQCAAYAGSRVQFGRPIGSFQAIQHKLAEMHIAMAASRFLTHHAAMALDEGADGQLEASRAKAFTGATLWRVATEAHQIHGGVGFVLDHPLHLYFAQARGADSLFGSTREHHQRVGQAVLGGIGHRPNLMLGVA